MLSKPTATLQTPRRPGPGGVEELVVDAVVEHRHRDVDALHQRQQLLALEPAGARDAPHLACLGEHLGRPTG